MKKIILCLSILFALTSCKINLDIFGKGTVQTASNSINCSNDGTTQSGDCTQTYNVDESNVTCDPLDPNCTVVTSTITETYTATPEQDDSFDGFADSCTGAGPCIKAISVNDANTAQAVTIEAHFDAEPTPQAATYNYNYLNQRTSKTVGGVTTYFIYDEQGNLLSEIDASGNSIKDYVYMEGEYVAHVEKTGDTAHDETQEQVFYPVNDHLGQPMMSMRADMQISHEQYTDPFGKMHAQYLDKSVGVDGVGAMQQNRRFPGQYYDAETSYSQNWHRDYDSSTGRYLQSDPIGLDGGINTYGYAYQSPVMYVDPDGNFGLLGGLVGAGAGAFAGGIAGGIGTIVGNGMMGNSWNDGLGTGIVDGAAGGALGGALYGSGAGISGAIAGELIGQLANAGTGADIVNNGNGVNQSPDSNPSCWVWVGSHILGNRHLENICENSCPTN